MFFLGRITTICQMISGIQKPVIKNVLHMDKEADRLREEEMIKRCAHYPLSVLLNLGVDQMRREKLIRKGKSTRGIQPGNNGNPMLLWLCQGNPEPAVEGTGIYILWDVTMNQEGTLPV